MPAVFVQIASYRDADLVSTLRDQIAEAPHPENLDSASVGSMTQAKTLVSSSRIRDFAWSMFPIETAKVAARPAFAEESKLPVAAVENKAGKFVLRLRKA
ncbi:MAG TPA: GlcNAc-transferase family protein, partial [Terriglobales bacterium]